MDSFHPSESWPLFSGWVVVGGGGGAYFLVKFWLFSKLFGSCFKIVWALFLDSEGPYLRVVSTQILFGDHQNRHFWVKFWPFFQNWYPWFGHFGVQKSRFFDFLKVGLELFRSCLGIIFGLKSLTFRCIFSSKGWYMTSKIKILCQNLALWEVHFDNFVGQKSRFFGLFESCFGEKLFGHRLWP